MNFNISTNTYNIYKPKENLPMNGPAPNANFSDFRCLDPNMKETGAPWFRIPDVCPCDTELSNPTGRGYTSCPFGVQTQQTTNDLISNLYASPSTNEPAAAEKLTGSFFPEISTFPIMAVPQFQPRPLAQIGYTWRSAN